MPFDWYLNMESVSLEIARTHIVSMTSDNYESAVFDDAECSARIPNEETFWNSFKQGFVAITMLSFLSRAA